jgi:hypothetical protein
MPTHILGIEAPLPLGPRSSKKKIDGAQQILGDQRRRLGETPFLTRAIFPGLDKNAHEASRSYGGIWVMTA